jgi:hypothetical protein
MKVFHNTYLSERDIDDKTAVMFFFDQYGAGGVKDRNADGFMPRDKQFGYMFTRGFASANELYIGAAHELGHGMFSLKHPFDNDYKIPALSTDNLMDYTPGATHIAKWQWDLIHDPGVIVRVFERDEDAKIMQNNAMDILKTIRQANLDGETTLKMSSYQGARQMNLSNVQLSQTKSISSLEIRVTIPQTSQPPFLINTYKIKDKCRICTKEGFTQYMFNDANTGFSIVVVVKEQEEKIFERYVFPAKEGTLQAKLEGDAPLTREEANEIRDEYIENIQDPVKKKEAYFMLQEKVTLVDPENFKNLADAAECFDACDSIIRRHYEELGKTYSPPFEAWSLATQDSASIYIHNECYAKAIMHLDDELGMGHPVMVGVDYKSGHPGNYDKITDHWVVITARRQDADGIYYTYMEVGQRDKGEVGFDLGTSTDRNRFYFDETGNYLVAIETTVNANQFIPVVTVIRGKSNDSCCKRSSYVTDKKADKANRIDKKNADGTFIVIRQNKSDYKIN